MFNQFKSDAKLAKKNHITKLFCINDFKNLFNFQFLRMSRDVRRYLRNPDKLFRRVRDKHGNLRLSKAAKAYHPGRGVYRSSYRNALRLTATENNMAYRTADHLRWQQQPFVVGIEIKLSNNHTCKGVIGRFVDICDDLAGVYPKDFKFVGWHPHCRCYCVPKQASKEEFMEYQQRLLNGEDVSNYHFKGEVKDLPRNFKDWYTDNTDRIARAKSQPYFLRDNQKLIEKNVPIAQYGHKAGAMIKADKKITDDTIIAMNSNYTVASLTAEQRYNAKEVAEIVGADLKKPMKFADIDSGNVNPKIGQSDKFDINCALSVVTAEARARGINVQALGVIEPKGKNKPISYQLGEDMTMAWIDAKGSTPKLLKHDIKGKYNEALTHINSITKNNGRYYIGFDGAEASHALSAYRVNGKLYIYDQQINGSYDLKKILKENEGVSKYRGILF